MLFGCTPTYELDGYVFVKYSGRYSFVRYEGMDAEITIPLEFKNKPVTAIAGLGPHRVEIDSCVKKITFQKNIKEVAFDVENYFNGSGLEEIIVTDDNEFFKSIDGVLFSKSGDELLFYPSAKHDELYIMPKTVTQFGMIFRGYLRNNFLRHNSHLKELYIPSETLILIHDISHLAKIYVPLPLLEGYLLSHPNCQDRFQPFPEDWDGEFIIADNE